MPPLLTRGDDSVRIVTEAGTRPPVRPSPLLGEHTGRVLFDVLEMEAEEVMRLREEKIVGY